MRDAHFPIFRKKKKKTDRMSIHHNKYDMIYIVHLIFNRMGPLVVSSHMQIRHAFRRAVKKTIHTPATRKVCLYRMS